jgi:hypothetical protein
LGESRPGEDGAESDESDKRFHVHSPISRWSVWVASQVSFGPTARLTDASKMGADSEKSFGNIAVIRTILHNLLGRQAGTRLMMEAAKKWPQARGQSKECP